MDRSALFVRSKRIYFININQKGAKAPKKGIMKAKDYKGITNLLEQKNPNKRFFNFMDFKDIIDYKMKLDRPKEKQIVDLLLKYKKASKEERNNIIKDILKIMRVDDKGQTRLLFPGEIGDLKDFAQAAV